ncbi:MAG: ABC transporter ATP-binding protein [Alphaproteobacteria bacterium]|nr:ABC transporter ATP-binding protein [Alphaproteobacteria bacterium]
MSDALLSTVSLRKSFGGVVAADGVSLEVVPGEIHAVIGPNGAGKTTLVNLLSGLLTPDAGDIVFDGRPVGRLSAAARVKRGLARSFQITSVLREFTAADNVALAIQARQGHSFKFWKPALEDLALRQPAATILAQVGLADRADIVAGNLAHGEQRQLEIAMVLATGPKMLLLDEPMAGMGIEESQRMVELLLDLKSQYTMLLIEHDMDAVFALADRITVLVYGREIATGAPADIRANAEVRDAYLGASETD